MGHTGLARLCLGHWYYRTRTKPTEVREAPTSTGEGGCHFELILSPWDFAAGALIVEEAGGVVTTVEGGELPCLEKSSLLARNL